MKLFARRTLPTITALLFGLALATGALAQAAGEDRLERRLLRNAEGLQMPSSEGDSAWTFVQYSGETATPDAARFQELSGCPVAEGGITTRLDFDAYLGRLGRIEPWMDEGQKRSARGFRRLERLVHRELDDLAVYRCETGGAEVYIYFVGTDGDRLAGLYTISIET
jgi:hypothetical protein